MSRPVPSAADVVLLGSLLDRVSDAVVLYAVDGDETTARITWVNDSFERLTGWTFDEIVGSGPGRLLAPTTEGEPIRRLFDGLRRGEAVSEEVELAHRDGGAMWIEVTAVPTRGADGRRWVCALYRDLTQQRHDQHRFGALIDQVSDIIAVLDGDLRLTYISPAVESVLGYRSDDLVGSHVLDLVTIEGGEHVDELFGTDDGTAPRPEVIEARATDVNGDVRLLEVGVNDRLDDPAINGLVVTIRDVTDRAAAATQLRRSEEWAHALLQGGTDVVLVTDGDGRIYYVSPSMTAMLGYEPEEMVGRSCFEYIDPSQVEEIALQWLDLVADESSYLPAQFRVRHVDGSWRDIDASARNMIEHPAVHGMVVHIRDVTERARAEEALRSSEEWAQALVQDGTDVVIVADRSGQMLYASPAARSVLGYEPEQLVGSSSFALIHPDDLATARDEFDAEVGGRGGHLPARLRARHHDGRWLQLSVTFNNLLDHRAVGGVVINARDITARWEAEQLLAQQALALEAVARGAPLDTTLYRVAQILEERLPGAHCAVGVVGEAGRILLRAAPTLDRQTVIALDDVGPTSPLGAAVRAGCRRMVVFEDLGHDSRWEDLLERVPRLSRYSCWSQLIIRPHSRETLGSLLVFHPDQRAPTSEESELLDRLMYLAAIAIERRNFEAALEFQALHDDLTGLPNRTLLLDRISQALARAQRHHTDLAVLFLDLDRFKIINDSLGHSMGDDLLRQAAARLRLPLRLGDTLGRLGGDEFLVVCERVDGEAGAVEIAERIITQLSAPFLLGDAEVFVSTSIGIALSGEKPIAAEALVRNADMAMYRAKEQGRSRHSVFEEDLALRATERHQLDQALRSALDEEQFELHYQPLISLVDGSIAGVEALVRWNRPGHGMVEPSDFIPVAEDTGLIEPIGAWVIAQACQQAAAWPPIADGSLVKVTVNLSARQLSDPGLIDFIAGHIAAAELGPERLCFEITESVLVDDVDAAIATVEKLKALGVLIAIDDFGTGYATLEYLRRFSMADFLKIDRSFVEGVDTGGSKETAIVAGAIALAKSLDFTVVAEGVETQAQVATLRGLECDLAQGYFFSRPLPATAAVALLEASPGWSVT